MPALALGAVGGGVVGLAGGVGGVLIWWAAGERGPSDDLGGIIAPFVWGGVGFLVAWPFGVAAGTYVYGTSIHGNGSFMAALAGSLLGTASMVGLGYLAFRWDSRGLGDLAIVGDLVIPPLASALGYYWTSSPPEAQPKVNLSLVQYDGRSGIRLGTPAVTVSAPNGVRTINVPLFAGRF